MKKKKNNQKKKDNYVQCQRKTIYKLVRGHIEKPLP